jgi:hypothetical protein
VIALTLTLLASCPCYTASSSSNTYMCGVEAANGTNPTVAQWQPIFATVGGGPAVWGTNGPAVADIHDGCGTPMPATNVHARFPCEVLKAIAMQESSWRQFCVPTTPADEVGGASRTIISFDCGYGIGQVTSGMHVGETPAFDRARVASDPAYNLATGTLILADKWRATPCVGDNRVDIIEDWYTSIWAYNGLSTSNSPNNPNFSSTRGVWNPSVGGSAPYQEKVFGWMEHPPAGGYWTAVAPAYPKLSDVGTGGSPPTLPDPSCASPTSCASTRSVHTTNCQGGAGGGTGTGGGSGTGGGAGTGGGSGATGGGTGTGGGSTSTGGGTAQSTDGGAIVLPQEDATLGPEATPGCGCGAEAGPWLLLAALALRRRSE